MVNADGKTKPTIHDKIISLVTINYHQSRSVPWPRKTRTRRMIRRARKTRRKRRS